MLHAITIFVTGLMVGNEFAVSAFVHPAISLLDEAAHAASAQRIAAVLGRVMPSWYGAALLTLLADTWAHHARGGSFLPLVVAAGLWAAPIVGTILFLVPLNNGIAGLDYRHPYPGWQKDRSRWDALHRWRVVTLTIAFALLLSAG